uniref:Uncharacterized protein LOC111133218 isoform X6 n=1 Tax=Crassostrea virginica TaxID=6565 RepID=A0A8B8EBP8_CRAVI|nr:uncharacterized protein LOC111133218 isoform X6 [Crassostrea virginica]
MDLHKNILPVLGILLASFFLFCESISKETSGYKFPVYSRPYCPRNEKEWNRRKAKLNCSKGTYACFPNNEFTELIEFCYPYLPERFRIEKGVCLYLSKENSKLNDTECKTFEFGCPPDSYSVDELFKYPSCVTVENGCFSADKCCQRSVLNTPQHTTPRFDTNQTDWTQIITSIGILLILFINGVVIYVVVNKIKKGNS